VAARATIYGREGTFLPMLGRLGRNSMGVAGVELQSKVMKA